MAIGLFSGLMGLLCRFLRSRFCADHLFDGAPRRQPGHIVLYIYEGAIHSHRHSGLLGFQKLQIFIEGKGNFFVQGFRRLPVPGLVAI